MQAGKQAAKGNKGTARGKKRGREIGRGDPRVIQVNKRISYLGQQRQFAEVLKAFESLGHKGMQASEVTYNVLLYACIRCGELEHAKTFLTQMLERNDLSPNVVTYTTVLKGFCVEGDMQAAEDLLAQMVVRRLKPNTRTINMYLRGCLWTGDLTRASSVWSQLSTLGVEPDFVSVDYMARILANCFRVADAKALLDAHPDMSISTGQVQLASALALLGDWPACQEALARAQAHLSEKLPIQADEENPEKLEKFHRHQQAELQAECKELAHFATNQQKHSSIELFKHFLPRVWLFPYTPGKAPLVPSLLGRLCEFTPQASAVIHKKFAGCLSASNRLRFSRIFPSRQPVKMELCSGLGEWATRMAQAEPSANWLACELRHDRCSTMLAKMVTLGVHNLAILGGPTQHVIKHIKSERISEVFANFPEPPADRSDASQNHLLNPGFIRSVRRVLRVGGKLTIVSDNLPYLSKLVREISQEEGFALALPAGPRVNGVEGVAKGLPRGYRANSSYFDRLWSARNKATRFFTCFAKQNIASSAAAGRRAVQASSPSLSEEEEEEEGDEGDVEERDNEKNGEEEPGEDEGDLGEEEEAHEEEEGGSDEGGDEGDGLE